jgi:beta-glucosidase-like glycosyl hydrolase
MKAVADHFTPEDLSRRALAAGVDSLLVCRDVQLRERVLATLEALPDSALAAGLRRMAEFKRRHSGGRHASGASAPYPEHLALAERLHSGEIA